MKINLLLLSLIFSCNLIFSQNISVESINRFETGELLEYRLHYGIFNTSYASLKLNNVILENKSVYLEEYARSQIGEEEQHSLELKIMLKDFS